MSAGSTKTAFGRIFPPRDAWLAKAPPEPIIDPDLPIIDTHHHLWHRTGGERGELWEVPAFRYLIDEFLADCATGHNIVGSVFLQCHSMYRATGPVQMRPVGETEFVAGIAAMSDSGGYGKTKVAAGIVGYADLTAGDWVTPVLEAHIRAGGGRFRGVRHSAGYDADPIIGNSAPDIQPGLYLRPDFRAGMAPPFRPWPVAGRLGFSPANARHHRPGTGVSSKQHHRWSLRRPVGIWPLRRQAERSIRGLEAIRHRSRQMPECYDEAWRHDDAAGGLRLHGTGCAAVLGTACGPLAPLC